MDQIRSSEAPAREPEHEEVEREAAFAGRVLLGSGASAVAPASLFATAPAVEPGAHGMTLYDHHHYDHHDRHHHDHYDHNDHY